MARSINAPPLLEGYSGEGGKRLIEGRASLMLERAPGVLRVSPVRPLDNAGNYKERFRPP
jgi:hypothetical protein